MAPYQTGWTVQGSPPVLDTTLPPVAINPFGPMGAPASFRTTTARTIIDSARLRHWSFADIELGDGAALLFLNQRQRELLANAGAAIEGLIGTAMEYAVTPGVPVVGQLFGFERGVPFVADPGQDGWPMHVDQDATPFVDPSEAPIAADPLARLGNAGGAQGFGLPQDMVRLINVIILYSGFGAASRMFLPCDITDERQRLAMLPGRNPVAFVAGNRLVPMLPLGGTFPSQGTVNNSADRWSNVSGIQISYVAVDKLVGLDDAITLPVVLCGALIAETAKLFAMQSRKISPADKKMFLDDAGAALSGAASNALDLLVSPEHDEVVYNG
jgi:hypothetical protein